MNKKYIILTLILTVSGSCSLWGAQPFDSVSFINKIFSELEQEKKASKTIGNKINQAKKIKDAYGMAAGQIIAKAMSVDSSTQQTLLNLMRDKLFKSFSLPVTAKEATDEQSDEEKDQLLDAQLFVSSAFDKYANTPNGYFPGASEALSLIRLSATDQKMQALNIDAFIDYIKQQLTTNAQVKAALNNKAADKVVAELLAESNLKTKNLLETRILINALIDNLLTKMGATAPVGNAMNQDATAKQIFDRFGNVNPHTMESYVGEAAQVVNDIKDNSALKKYVALNSLRTVMLGLVTPPPPPAAARFQKTEDRKWFEKMTDAITYAFSKDVWVDKVGKEFFQNMVYEQGLKKLGELLDDYLIKKPRELSHQIADTANGIATQLSNVPNQARAGAIEIIGGFQGNKLVPSLEQNLRTGAKKLGESIAKIRTSIQEAQKQKADVVALKLDEKRLVEFKQLNELLMDAFPALEDALTALANADCSSGVLCDIQKALLRAADQAKIDIEDIEDNIRSTDRKINHPTLLEDGVVESLPNRLHNIATTLSF